MKSVKLIKVFGAPQPSGLKAEAVAGTSAKAVLVIQSLLLLTCATLVCGSALVHLRNSSTPDAAALPDASQPKAWFTLYNRRYIFSAAMDSSSSSRNLSEIAREVALSFDSSRGFNASQFANAEELLLAHQHRQAHRLKEAQQAAAAGTPFVLPKAVLYRQMTAGWGNRLPAVVTGMMLAMFTDRVFLMVHENSITDYLDFHWDVDFSNYSALYSKSSRCNVDFNRLTHPDLEFCTWPSKTADVDVIEYASIDYDVPLLEVNPALQSTLGRLFPSGNIFHEVAARVFSFSQLVQRTAAPYSLLAGDCLVGVQVRHRKTQPGVVNVPLSDVTVQFAGIAKSLAGHAAGTVFIAADVAIYGQLAQLLPGRTVWWSNESQSSIETANSVGNPGTDLSAFVDLYLLTRCKHLVCTAASSFGSIAAGYGDIVPVYAIKAQRKSPFYSPVFWKAVTSEPHFWHAGHDSHSDLSNDNLALLSAHHTHWVQLQQLHY